jgi:hypothetical protein
MTLRPAPKPCRSCPYRLDVLSGIWDADEYAKLPQYDGETWEQPHGMFQCHQNERDDAQARVCAGWAGCHDTDNLMALRLAGAFGTMADDELRATIDYSTDVPLFASGAEAAAHGMADIDHPSPDAIRLVGKIIRRRPDVR